MLEIKSPFLPLHYHGGLVHSLGWFRDTGSVHNTLKYNTFPHIPYRNRPSEQVVTEYLKTDLVQTPVFVAYGGYLEPTE